MKDKHDRNVEVEDSASYIAENDDHSSTPDVMIVIIIFNDKWWSGLIPLKHTRTHFFVVFCLLFK